MFWTKLIPRSLALQSVMLVVTAMVISTAIVITFFLGQYRQEEEERLRNQAALEFLEKHYQLRLAISLRDKDQATGALEEVLQQTQNPDVVYIALLDDNKQPIASVGSKGVTAERVADLVARHAKALGASSVLEKEGVKAFEQEVKRETETAGQADPDNPFADPTQPTTKETGVKTLGYILVGLSAEASQARFRLQTLQVIGAFSLGLFTIFILAYLNWLSRRLGRIMRFSEAFAAGDLNQRLEDPVQDQVGRTAAGVFRASGQFGDVIKQLLEASGQLQVVSTTILESASHQSSSATRQANSLAEMGATMAELRETFAQAASKAQEVIDLARKSEQSSTGGSEAVTESITGMAQIKEQVEAIVANMQGLSQRTNQIVAIIDVVNDLAEQSNILALNAGIEAARAGEHGRGFAVVAREVRSLAERSKQSTAQVRSILRDIENAVKEAVRSIEEGSRRAESGMNVANAAGAAIQRLAEAIATSSQAALQIAASTRQQSMGIEEIWSAIREIDRAASETASGIQNLESTAANMKTLSDGMSKVVSLYRT